MDRTSKHVATMAMIVSAIIGGYGMKNVLGYVYNGGIRPLFFGQPMPFSTSCGFVLIGWFVCFWLAWDMRRRSMTALSKPRRKASAAEVAASERWTPADIQKLVGMIIGLLSAALMVLGGLKNR